jgi:hypothetical protein
MHVKLATMQDMFTSTRPVSVLYLRGAEQDDPDLFPVQLSGEPDLSPLTRQETWESKPSVVSSPSSSGSPTSSSVSTVTPNRRASAYQEPLTSGLPRKGTDLWSEQQVKSKQSAEQATKVPRREIAGAQGSSILAIGVDAAYEPLPNPPTRPGKSSFYSAVGVLLTRLQLLASMSGQNMPRTTTTEQYISCNALSKTW